MQIYQGIQLVYTHVVQLIQSIGTWFTEINWSIITDVMPLPVAGLFAIVLAMSAIGLVKKLSFLLG